MSSNLTPIIEFREVSKIFKTYSHPRQRMIEILSGGRIKYAREVKALVDINLSLYPGDRLGILGENGSGKSTLLKILSGVLQPTSGRVIVNGRISALLELGAGFHNELTGIENIKQFCFLHGLSEKETEQATPSIIEFSELGDSIHYPVKTYSSGMSVRLGFACSVYVKPDILIIDEALSVGDAYFQNKCMNKIQELLNSKVTFLYVTHAVDSVRSLCNQGIWLDHGKIRMKGGSAEVTMAYQSEVFRKMVHLEKGVGELTEDELKDLSETEEEAEFERRVRPFRMGSGEARIVNVQCNKKIFELEEEIEINIKIKKLNLISKDNYLSIGINNSQNIQILFFYYELEKKIENDSIISLLFNNKLSNGKYNVHVGISQINLKTNSNDSFQISKILDYCPYSFEFKSDINNRDQKIFSLVFTEHQFNFSSIT
jgi:lipopolysaccharide transport system ATP-binding protein